MSGSDGRVMLRVRVWLAAAVSHEGDSGMSSQGAAGLAAQFNTTGAGSGFKTCLAACSARMAQAGSDAGSDRAGNRMQRRRAR